jgi:2-polyprenyl-6-methoxyphenol hydroxylase-like FAD-dependent oxidoreductase
MEGNAEIVIVGGGIAGMATASALARDGHRVTVLKAAPHYEDRVRAESMLPREALARLASGTTRGSSGASATSPCDQDPDRK